MEEYAPDIVYIKGVHNTVADAISRLEYNPALNPTNEYTHATVRVPTGEPSTDPSKWKAVAKHWRCYNECYATTNTSNVVIDTVFTNCSEENDLYPLTTVEIAEAQKADAAYKDLFKHNAVIDKGLEIKLIENTLCVCKDGRLVIYLSHSSGEQYYGTTLICSTLDTLASKRRQTLRCTGKVCVPQSGQLLSPARHAKLINDEVTSTVTYRLNFRHKHPLGMLVCQPNRSTRY